MATINLPGFQWPASSTEYVLAMAAYLIGIFIVASIIGEVSTKLYSAGAAAGTSQIICDLCQQRMANGKEDWEKCVCGGGGVCMCGGVYACVVLCMCVCDVCVLEE